MSTGAEKTGKVSGNRLAGFQRMAGAPPRVPAAASLSRALPFQQAWIAGNPPIESQAPSGNRPPLDPKRPRTTDRNDSWDQKTWFRTGIEYASR